MKATVSLVLSVRVHHNLAVLWELRVQQEKKVHKMIILEHSMNV